MGLGYTILMVSHISRLSFILFTALAFLSWQQPVFAQEMPVQENIWSYEVGTVAEIAQEERYEDGDQVFYSQLLRVQKSNGEIVEVVLGSEFQPLAHDQRLSVGEQIILTESEIPGLDGEKISAVADTYRIPVLLWLLLGFFAVVAAVSGIKGLLSIIGMLSSLVILTFFVLPMLLSGANPVLVTLLAAFIIAVITVYVSHGFKQLSHIALISMLGTLLVVTLLSYWYIALAKLTGLGSEEAAFLQFGNTATINLRGLLLGGIMLGALGVLDDITISQVSTVFELRRANEKLPFQELYQRGMRVGRDHVASLVNTLVLAYAGANLPLLILFTISEGTPSWVHLNSEILAEEIVRTLIGSLGLVMAVPLTTALAAYWVSKKDIEEIEETHSHSH